jgi:hypothetical protein
MTHPTLDLVGVGLNATRFRTDRQGAAHELSQLTTIVH